MADWDYVTSKANSELDSEFRNGLYLAAFTTAPAADGTGGTECSYTGYARLQLTTSNMAAAAARSITNSATLTLGTTNSSTLQTVTHLAIMSASSGGTMTSRLEMSSSYAVPNGGALTFAPGQFVATLPATVT